MGAKLFNAILRSGSMLDKWRKSILFPIYMKNEIFKSVWTILHLTHDSHDGTLEVT